VVEFDSNEAEFSLDAIKFNPSTITPSNWAGVPVYVSADYENLVSSPNYHNVANLAVGKGDPCKLVGLTVATIKAKLAGNELPADSGWRLPTARESYYFVGGNHILTEAISTDAFVNSTYPYWTNAPWSGGRFPITSWGTGTDGSPVNTSGSFVPAVGYRTAAGAVGNQGTTGYYRTSTPNASSSSYILRLAQSQTAPSNSQPFSLGFAIRCVKP
jgi:hypothetical protein